jgi:phosphopantetheinyl transferase
MKDLDISELIKSSHITTETYFLEEDLVDLRFHYFSHNLIQYLDSLTNRIEHKKNLRARILQHYIADALELPYEEISIQTNVFGKPMYKDFEFNSSWTKHVFVIARHLDSLPIGIDLEHKMYLDSLTLSKNKIKRLASVVDSFFTAAEAEWINSHLHNQDDVNWIDRFYQVWCRKEAVIKAWGVSIGSHSLDVSCVMNDESLEICRNNNIWLLKDVKLPDYYCSICYEVKN